MTPLAPDSTSIEGTEAVRARAGGTQAPIRVSRKARTLKAEVIEAASAAALQTAIQAWFDGTTEEEFIEMYSTSAAYQPAHAGAVATYCVTIIYII